MVMRKSAALVPVRAAVSRPVAGAPAAFVHVNVVDIPAPVVDRLPYATVPVAVSADTAVPVNEVVAVPPPLAPALTVNVPALAAGVRLWGTKLTHTVQDPPSASKVLPVTQVLLVPEMTKSGTTAPLVSNIATVVSGPVTWELMPFVKVNEL